MENVTVNLSYVDADGSKNTKEYDNQTREQAQSLFNSYILNDKITLYNFTVVTPTGKQTIMRGMQAARALQQPVTAKQS
jgi:hypothetical protein